MSPPSLLTFRRGRCGECAACLRQDCGTCDVCKKKIKFGGDGSSHKVCLLRRCQRSSASSTTSPPSSRVSKLDEQETSLLNTNPDHLSMSVAEGVKRKKRTEMNKSNNSSNNTSATTSLPPATTSSKRSTLHSGADQPAANSNSSHTSSLSRFCYI